MRIRNHKLVSTIVIAAVVLLFAFIISSMFNGLNNNIQPISEPNSSKIEQFKIVDHAKKITVRVSGENRFGSGVLVSRRETGNPNLTGYYYLVLTCHHNVLPDSSAKSKNFYVFTSDNIAYPASLFRNKEQRLFPDIDLDFLYFYSPLNITYELAVKPTKSVIVKSNDNLIVAGYPCEGDGCPNVNSLTITQGLATTIKKSLKNGYQLGFSADFNEGTSGGPVLNNNGQLIGVAGKRKGIYNNSNQQYIYIDKSLPSNQQIEEYKKLAWALPVDENIFTLSDKLFQNASFQNTTQKENTDSNKNLEKLIAVYSEIKPYFFYLSISIIILLFVITILLVLCYLLISKSAKRS